MNGFFLKKQGLLWILLFSNLTLFPQTFTELTGTTIPGVNYSSISPGDIDKDGNLDFFITGSAGSSLLSKIYINNGNSTFTELSSVYFPGVFYGSACWRDYDNDGDLDILLTGSINISISSADLISKIYRNDGSNTFTSLSGINITPLYYSFTDWGDYDNDGYSDILISGATGSDVAVTKIYHNNGDDTFSEETGIIIQSVQRGITKWVDFDTDGYLDIFISGSSSQGIISKFYHNNGNGTFTTIINTNIPGMADGSVEWCDYDNDGDPDFLISGLGLTRIYRNDGNCIFTQQSNITLPGLRYSSASWGDYDNDGHSDFVITGSTNSSYSGAITKIYHNNGNDTFTELSGTSLPGVYKGSVIWADLDKDGRLDLMLSGINSSNTRITKIFKNNTTVSNNAPLSVGGLLSSVNDSSVVLKWNRVQGDSTPARGMSFNIRIGFSPGAGNIVSPMVNGSGYRLLTGYGNTFSDTIFILKHLKKNTYYWSVQAIDNGYSAGPFASDQLFTFSASLQAYKVITERIQGSAVDLRWQRGNGNGCMVFAKKDNLGYASPQNNTSYIANSHFGLGTQIGSTGWFCVYNGTDMTVTVTDLEGLTDYIFQVFEYNTGPLFYNNSGQGNPVTARTSVFTEQTGLNLYGDIWSSEQWGDYNNDGYLDLIIAGYSETKIYMNNGDKTFSEQTGISPPATYHGVVKWGDYNNDGYLDILISGYGFSKIYRNNGGTTFTEMPSAGFIGLTSSSADWGDLDNDGDLDVILSGMSGTTEVTKIYRNNGDNSFTEQPGIDISGSSSGIIKCVDYNNDSYIDIFISSANFSKIYHNNSDFTFTEQTDINLFAIQNGSVDWGDYDNDGRIDVIIAGYNGAYGVRTKVYRNLGNNVFSEQNDIVLPVLQDCSIVWGDYNSDGYLDILMSGDNWYIPMTKIYLNNRDNTFSVQDNISLPDLSYSAAAWADCDNDNDLDFLVTGTTTSGISKSFIFLNDLIVKNTRPQSPMGLKVTKDTYSTILSWNPVTTDETPPKGLSYNLLVGTTSGGEQIKTAMSSVIGFHRLASYGNCFLDTFYILRNLLPKTYYWTVQAIDNGFYSSSFAPENSFTIDSIQSSRLEGELLSNNSSGIKVKWKNGNGSHRIVFCKQGTSGIALPVNNKTYSDDPIFGYGDQISNSGWYCVFNGRADSTTVYGLSPGVAYSFNVIEYIGMTGNEKYYRCSGAANPGIFSTGIFSEQTDISLSESYHVAWGDYDNDGLLDILLSGYPSKVYHNNGDNSFTQLSGVTFPNSAFATWSDFDNDGDLDIFVPVDLGLKIFLNNNSIFSEIPELTTPIKDAYSFSWCDYDTDGNMDFLITGTSGTYPDFNPASIIYHNDGDNNFQPQEDIALEGVWYSSSVWGDYDNDGDLDILLTGTNSSSKFTKLYRNDGKNSFIEQSDIQLARVYLSSIAWGDYDNDEDLDILLTGAGAGRISKIYRNERNNKFNEQTGINLTGVDYGSVAWGDYDNDGYLDILLTGRTQQGNNISKIYHNNGNNSFTEVTSIFLTGVFVSSVACGDYDNDGDLDILMSGNTGSANITKVYRNNIIMKSGSFTANIKPGTILNNKVLFQPDGIKLAWSPLKEDETPYKAMTYNIRIGNSRKGSNICPSQTDSITGYRRINEMGNANMDTTYFIRNLASGKYYWSVQAVDQGYMGGTWSAIDSFEVRNVQAFYSADEVCLGLSTTFTDQSVATDSIAEWKWDFRDGSSSSEQNPVHTYSISGNYNVKLVITDNSGIKDSLEQSVIVKPKPLTGFSAPAVCQGIPVTTTNTTNNNGLTISSWSWNFGDGGTSTDLQPAPHGYLNAGDYSVKLKAVGSNGCADSVTNIVSVGSYPVAAVTANAPLTFCKGDSVTLSVPYNADYLYTWKVDGTNLTGGDSSKYMSKLTGSYSVELVNPKGSCTTTSSAVAITVKDAPAAPLISAAGVVTFCQGDSVILSVTNTLNYTYQWKLNGGAVGSNSCRFSAKNGGTYNLSVTNSTGCSVASTNSVTVTVNPSPTAGNISLQGEKSFCEGESATLSVPLTAGYTYKWRNENELIPGAEAESYVVTASGTYQLEISNSSGCLVRTTPVSITVKPTPERPVLRSTNYTKDVCPGDNPIRLSAIREVAEYGYLWYKDGQPQYSDTLSYIEFYEGGFYMLEAKLSECSSESKVDTINLPNGPEKPVIYVRGSIVWYLACSNMTANDYRWYRDGKLIEGAKSYFYVAGNIVGLYQVSIADIQGCFTRSDLVAVPAGYTGIDDVDLFTGLKIYPNPTTGLINIEIENEIIGDLLIKIINQDGKELYNFIFEKSSAYFSTELNLGGQPEGYYLIIFDLNRKLAVKKIILE
ncbi:MAG: FG-GAP-like repeat-containing protein [Bacteroidia bacterium]|nr:FG-GAP-like repeat-containing protein [Bacteroidia bacterium]